MATNETTTKFKVDISDLKKGIQEANRQIKLANAEFKSASAAMDKWSTSTDGLSAKITQTEKVLSSQKTILSAYEKELEAVTAQYGANSKEADNAKIKYENQRAAVIKTEKSLSDYKTALTNLEAEQKAQAEASEKQETAFESLKKTIDAQDSELASLKSQYANVVLEQGKNSEAAQDLANEISNLSGELKDNKTKLSEAEGAADEFDQSLDDLGDSAEGAKGGLDVFTVALGNLVADAISSAISALKDLAGETIEVGKQFDKSMSNVAALSGASADELQMLRDTAKDFGSTTQFSASEAADALGYMALAGWDAETSASALGGVLNLAAASGMDLAAASDMVTDYMSAFNLEAEDSAYFADLLAYAQSNANTTAEGLGEAFKNCAANMNAAGQDVETTTALLSMMANQGLKGSEAGTALTAVMRDMTAKMKDGKIAIGETSVEVMDANGNYRDMTDILADVEAATNGMGDAERASALMATFTSDSIKGLNLMLNAGVDEAKAFEDELRNSTGSAKDMADVMNDNLNGDLTALGSKLEGVQIAIYEKFEPALRDGVDILSGLLDAVDFVVDHSTEFVAALAAMATGIATYLGFRTAMQIMEKGWTSLTLVTKAQAAAQALLNAVTALSPWMWVVTGIMALVAAFVVLWNKSEAFRNFWLGLWETVKTAVVNFYQQYLQPIFVAIGEKVTELVTTLQNLWNQYILPILITVGEKIMEIWNTYISPVIEAIKQAFTFLWENVLSPILGYIIERFTNTFNTIKTLWETVLKPVLEALWTLFKWIWEVVLKVILIAIATEFALVFNGIKLLWQNVLKPIFQAIGEFFKFVWETILSPVLGFIIDTFTTVFNGIKTLWDEVLKPIFQAIGDKFQEIWETYLKPTIEAIQEAFEKMGEAIGEVWNGLWTNILKPVINSILGGIETLANGVVRGINRVIDVLNGLSFTIPDWVPDFGGKTFGFNIGKLNEISLPRLYSGGVLKKGQLGLLEGDGAEAVVPLENNTKWIRATAEALKDSLTNEEIIGGSTNNQSVINYNYNYTQNNTSPRALNRLEIYRQTGNQLAFYTGGR